jgi:mono/diheme cytochrome c family protein
MTRTVRTVLGLVVVLLLLAAATVALNHRDEDAVDDSAPPGPAPQALVERGAYLAKAGNCVGCHTARGGAPFAGGRAIDTPFGTVYSSNLTPDADTGLGRWNASHFWRALHNGRSKEGRLLYPAFPYPNYTEVTREDADAIYAYLRSLPPVRQPQRPHELRFPYNLQASLAVWRALFFHPGSYRADSAQTAEWNRGAYLVRGLGHCDACHAERNFLGATSSSSQAELSGGLIPMQRWYAPSLTESAHADPAALVQLLKTGNSPRRSVMGPMAEVVFRSTQYLNDADVQSMAAYLRSLPPPEPPPKRKHPPKLEPGQLQLGAQLYHDRCAACHGDQGQGAPGAYPALAGNRAVTMPDPTNLLHAIVDGGFPPATAGNPRPYGMPPFGQALDDRQIAAIATFLRRSWGHDAEPVTSLEALHVR